MGGVIMPPIPAFYYIPKTVNNLIDQSVGKVLDLFFIDAMLFRSGESAGDKGCKRQSIAEKR